MTDDIEHLKVHKIAPRTTSDRMFLPQVDHAPAPSTPPDEVFADGVEPPSGPVDAQAAQQSVMDALATIFDPEIPVNIVDLGLIYDVIVTEDGVAEIKMTLTAPACPVAGAIVEEVAQKAGHVSGIAKAHVVLVWDPPWSPDRMTEAAKLELGLI